MAIPRAPKGPDNQTNQNPAVAHEDESPHDPRSQDLPLIPRSLAKCKQTTDTNGHTEAADDEVNHRPSPDHSPIRMADRTVTGGGVHMWASAKLTDDEERAKALRIGRVA